VFWLSHHHPHELNRTYRLGGVHVCARCLGTYPVLLLAIAAQVSIKAPLHHALDPVAALALPVPALLDWSIGRFRPAAGSNLVRTLTGVLLGLGLGRTLYVHLREPFPFWLCVQLAVLLAVAVPVMILAIRKGDTGPKS
jgi:uncharacterized membrane protein